MTTSPTHAELSPSRAHRWMVCPGSIREEAKYPDRGGGTAAIDGTHSHTLLEYCIKNKTKAMYMIGETLTDHEGTFTVDAERAWRVMLAVEYIDMTRMMREANVIAESRVNPERLTGRSDMGGTVDVQMFYGDTIEIIDYKDGHSPVEAENNPQLLQYAVGVLAGLPDDHEYKQITLTIIQPRLAEKGGKGIVSQTLDINSVMRIIPDMVAAAAKTDLPDAPLVPGDSQCKYCKAKGACTALANSVMEKVGVMFKPVEPAPVVSEQAPVVSEQAPVVANPAVMEIAEQAAGKDVSTMTGDQLRQIVEAAPLVRQLLEAVEAEALHRMQAGESVAGLKLVHGRGSRAWNLSDDEIADKLVKMGVPKSAVYETKLVSPAKAEKLVWTKRDGTQHQLTERQKKIMHDEYVSRMAGKLVVAHESDSRPAVVMDAAPMFSAVEEKQDLPAWLL